MLTAVKTRYLPTSITWPYRGLRCRSIKVEYFFEVICWQVTGFEMIAGSSLFFKNSYERCCVYVTMAPHYFAFKLTLDVKIPPAIWKYRRGRPFLTKVKCWSLSTSDFYALIGQNLTGEFMWKINAASWNLLPLTAEADRVLCQLFNRLFPLDVQNEIRLLSGVFSYSWPVCLLFFCLRDASLVKVGNPISDGIVFVFGLACCVRGFKKKVSNDSGLTW